MKRIAIIIFSILVILLGLSFSVINAEPVVVNYYFGQLKLPLSMLLVFALAGGALMGVLASLGIILKTKSQLHRLRKDAKIREQEIVNLRAIPMKDTH